MALWNFQKILLVAGGHWVGILDACGIGGGVKSTRFGYAFTVRKLGLPPGVSHNAYYGPRNVFPVAFCDIGRRRGPDGGKTAPAIGPEEKRALWPAAVRTFSFSRVAVAAGPGRRRLWPWPLSLQLSPGIAPGIVGRRGYR